MKFIRMRRPSVSLILMTKIRADHHQTEIKLDLTLETKTLHVTRVLDRDSISISTHFNGFYKGRYRAVSRTIPTLVEILVEHPAVVV